MVNDITDWRLSWTGENAQYVDSCTPASNPQVVTLKDWLITTATSIWIWGGVLAEGPGCFMFAQWSSWAPDLLNYVSRVQQSLSDSGTTTYID